MQTFAALLRGINVGGRNTIPMAELRSALTALGLEDVRTYLQSGNVVFRSAGGDRHELPARIEGQIAERCGVRPAVLLRTAGELEEMADNNPFLQLEGDHAKLHVVFLEGSPTKAAARLDPDRSPPDRFSVRGREIYLHLPNGAGRSKLTIDYFERTLGVRATARNWRTVNQLLALAQD
jgi:uncharacterized protein (DUF1697 family)